MGEPYVAKAHELPPTILVVHPRERRSKCTVEPLRGRDGFVFVMFPDKVPLPLDSYVRLGLGGTELSCVDAGSGLLVLDGTWKLAARMEPFYSGIPVRTLPLIRTACPRVSRLYRDPAGGLSTIEAVYAAMRILGRPVRGLLDDYHWKGEFLEKNGWTDAATLIAEP